ncbi:MAG: von Willebrand factor type A domain-containing protein [Wujia sp.]
MRGRTTKKIMAMSLSAIMLLGMTGCGTKDLTGSNEDRKDRTTEAANGGTTTNIKDDNTQDVVGDIYEYYEYETAADEDIYIPEYPDYNTNEYNDYTENSFMAVASDPLSTFAADVDTAAYSEIRSYIMNGYNVDSSMVRIEEMINYFHYDYEAPKDGEPFAVYTEYTDCPWNEDTKLALISLKTEDIDFSEAPASNIVFLIDTSGSMFDANKLPLVQQSLCMLAENFTEKDRISIVTYAGQDTVVLEGVSGDKYSTIVDAIEGLEANGSTNGSAGINTAYDLAEKYFIEGGNNRVILATDGDLNVGVTSEGALTELIKEKKDTGVFLSVIGVGYGNYKDNKLEALADNGNGNYSYIDSIFEAKKALVDELGATMITVAKDVKLQVEFNPANVKGYRLIGYENRVMAATDFADDTKDGGEMGAGHVVTALYEIVPVDSDMEIGDVDLKYDGTEPITYNNSSEYADEMFTLKVRYKEPESDKSSELSFVCDKEDYSKEGSDNMRWAAAVAAFGLCLKDSEYKGTADVELITRLAKSVDYGDDEYKQQFIELVGIYFDGIYFDDVEGY